MLRILTAGESHGKGLLALIEGLPAGLAIDEDFINSELSLRQKGYGRGARMSIETDTVEIYSGVLKGKTIGSPLSLLIKNKDYCIEEKPLLGAPRPGHADLAGMLKYGFEDPRPVLERASARETAARTAAGAVCKLFLKQCGIQTASFVDSIAGVCDSGCYLDAPLSEIRQKTAASDLRMLSKECETKAMALIDEAMREGFTLGGTFVVMADGAMPGLGSYAQWDRKLDAAIGAALLSVQAVKAVEFGLGFGFAGLKGTQTADEIFYDPSMEKSRSKGFYRKTNRAGGIEGGMSNGERIAARCCVKPVPTLKQGLMTVDAVSKAPRPAPYERSDTCVTAPASVAAEAALCAALACSVLEKFPGDSMPEVLKGINS